MYLCAKRYARASISRMHRLYHRPFGSIVTDCTQSEAAIAHRPYIFGVRKHMMPFQRM